MYQDTCNTSIDLFQSYAKRIQTSAMKPTKLCFGWSSMSPVDDMAEIAPSSRC